MKKIKYLIFLSISLLLLLLSACKANSYKIDFISDDNIIYTNYVNKNEKLEKPEAILKEGYTFNGWYLDNEYQSLYDFDNLVTSSFSLYAKWDIIQYTITWKNDDGTILKTNLVNYDTLPSYEGELPSKESDSGLTYYFNGWDKEIVKAKENTTYTATYSSVKNKYVISFLNYDNTILEQKTYDYGDEPTYTGSTPTKTSDIIYSYEFISFSPEIEIVTKDQSYIATYKNNPYKFTITYHLNGGENDVSNPDYFYSNNVSGITLGDATYKRLTFEGWYLDSDYKTKITTISNKYLSNLDLYAKFTGPLIYYYTDNLGPYTLFGKDVEVSFTDDYMNEWLNNTSSLLEDINNGTKDYSEIKSSYNEYKNSSSYLNNQYVYATLISDAKAQEDDYETLNNIVELRIKYSEYKTTYDLAFYNSVYKDNYYSGWTEERLNTYIASLDPEAQAKKSQYQIAMNEALNNYYAGSLDAYDALVKYSTNANLYAKSESYENYLYYQYIKSFDRDYTVDDSSNLSNYITTTIIPLYTKSYNSYKTFINSATTDQINQFKELNDATFSYYFDYLDSYAELVGSDYLDNYKHLFESGNYFLSDTDNDNVTGYTWSFVDGTGAFIFFGKNYQDVSTFIHEFGHYNAILEYGGYTSSLDIAETQSQGNELLFYKYLTTTDLYDEYVIEAFLNYQVASMANVVISGFIINEIEKYVYSTDLSNVTEDEFWNEITAICQKYDTLYYQRQSWIMSVLLNYQGYYISYAASAISSLELYATAVSDYDKALDMYRIIYSSKALSLDFTGLLEYVGLYGVFSDECYSLLQTLL